VLRQSSEEGSEGSPKAEADGTDENKRRSSKEDGSKDRDGSPEEGKEKKSSEDAPGKYPRGVLIYHKSKKGPKKVVRWKQEKDLETIKYFELDETERGKSSLLYRSEMYGLVDITHTIMLSVSCLPVLLFTHLTFNGRTKQCSIKCIPLHLKRKILSHTGIEIVCCCVCNRNVAFKKPYAVG